MRHIIITINGKLGLRWIWPRIEHRNAQFYRFSIAFRFLQDSALLFQRHSCNARHILSIYMSICMSISLSICLSICLSCPFFELSYIIDWPPKNTFLDYSFMFAATPIGFLVLKTNIPMKRFLKQCL